MSQSRIFNVVPTGSGQQGNSPFLQVTAWTQVTVLKETSGVVSMGVGPNLVPFDVGTGMQLPVDQPVTFLMSPGSSLFLAALTVEKVSVIVQDLTDLFSTVRQMFEGLALSLGSVMRGAVQQRTVKKLGY